MSQILRVGGQAMLIDSELGSQEILLQRPLRDTTRNTTLKAAVSQLVTTTAENLNMGNVTSEGEAYLWNEESDPTNATYIMVGWDVSGTFTEAFRVSPGPAGWQKVSLSPDRTWQVKTNSSTAFLGGFVLQRNS